MLGEIELALLLDHLWIANPGTTITLYAKGSCMSTINVAVVDVVLISVDVVEGAAY